MGDDIVQTL